VREELKGASQLASPSVITVRHRRQFEIAFINAKLQEHGGNITRTAAAIGIHRQSLQEKLRELGIQAAR
jgi:DNA-binding NtrC family response regulator